METQERTRGRRPAPGDRRVTSVNVGVEQLARLKALAEREDLSQSQLIRRAVEKFLTESGA